MSHQRYKPLIESYLHYLHSGDTQGILELFEEDAIVYSPFLGRVEAEPFFHKLAETTANSTITEFDVFGSLNDSRCATAFFRYDWKLKDGTNVAFDCVDVFEFNETDDKISSLTIIYDTFPVRQKVGDKYSMS